MPAYASLRRVSRKADRLSQVALAQYRSAIDGLLEAARLRREVADQQAAEATALVDEAAVKRAAAAQNRAEAAKAETRAQRLADLID